MTDTAQKPRLWTKGFLLDTLVNFLIYIIYYMLMVIIASEAIRPLHASMSEAGLASGIFILGTLLARIFAGRSVELFDRKGEDFVMYPTYACLAGGLLLLSITTSSWMMLLTGVFVGLGYGTFMSNGQAICVKLVEEVRIGVTVSTYFVALDLGLGIGPYMLGAFKESLGFSGIYSAVGLAAAGYGALYYLLYARRRNADTANDVEESLEEELA